MKVNPKNLPAVIGARLAEWARLAETGASLADRARGRHNFKMLARDNPTIAHHMSTEFGYLRALRELTPEIAKKRRFSSGGKRA